MLLIVNQKQKYAFLFFTSEYKTGMEILHVFAINMKKYRNDAGISQEKLAELTGLHRTYICAVENEKRNISLQNIQRISCALGISPEMLLQSSDK